VRATTPAARAEPAPMNRLARAWRALAAERRAAALLSAGLFASMFLHWYSKTDTLVVHGTAKATETSLSAFQAFSFVEAAVLLVSAGVLTMLFARAEGRHFQVPGGDGLIVMIAGGWAALLIFYRMLDKPGLHGNARVTATVGVEWGIFVALLLALGLLAAGRRIRAHERPEPPLLRARAPLAHEPPPPLAHEPATPLEQEPPTVVASARAPRPAAASAAGRRRPRYPPAPARAGAKARGEQLSFEDPPAGEG